MHAPIADPASAKPLARPREARAALAEAVVLSALNACRDDALAAWMLRHRRIARWLHAGPLALVRSAAGPALRDDASGALALRWLLLWALHGLRPDHMVLPLPPLAALGQEAWLNSPRWRPALAALCHFGFEPVPAWRERYRAHPGEAPASQLCGLWSVGPSSYYRYLEKAKRLLAEGLRHGVPEVPRRQALRAWASAQAAAAQGLSEGDARRRWHGREAEAASGQGDVSGALWHCLQAADGARFAAALQRASQGLAGDAEVDAMVHAMLAVPSLASDQRFALWMAWAALWEARGHADHQLAAYEQARRLAAEADDALMLGGVYSALGKYHESRDADRAFAFYVDCTDALWRAGIDEAPTATGPAPAMDAAAQAVLETYVVALVRLAWLHVVRNDPRAKAALERAEALRSRRAVSVSTQAMLEQAWGEHWRRRGELARAVEHKHRALNLYERAGDTASVLKTCCNLGLIYGELRDFPRAIDYSQRVIRLAERGAAVAPEVLASTHLNMGVACFWQQEMARAETHYRQALEIAQHAQLGRVAGIAHYNLAELAYLRYKRGRDRADEHLGDQHTAASRAVWPDASDAAYAEARQRLKGEILGGDAAATPDRLTPAEAVLHPAEMAQVQAQREVLAVPAAPEPHVRAHLSIAQAYLAVAMKEREAALALMQRHGLAPERFAGDLQALRIAYERELTREQRLARAWTAAAGDLLSAARCETVIAHLLAHETLSKSVYAQLCGLSPATASKHLTLLAERGLLAQSGKGPASRYRLHAAVAGQQA